MKDESGSESDDSVMSPGAFLAGLEPGSSFKERQERFKIDPLPKSYSQQLSRFSIYETKSSEKSQRKKLAGLKSRVKKQKQLQRLQESVSQLTTMIQQCDQEISKCKDELVEAIKLSTHSSSEHAYTFSELERLITEEDIDLDQINLLLDIIQSRIGANGKQRQSKLEYNFKQIINSIFPALHRYLMYSAVNQKDIFSQQVDQYSHQTLCIQKWTRQLYDDLKLQPQKWRKFKQRKSFFTKKRYETIELIAKLKSIKDQLKQQQQTVQDAITGIRTQMSPVQSSRVLLFGQKNKLRRQFLFLDEIFMTDDTPTKQVKLQ